MITLTQRIGDTKTHSVKLAWEGRPFVPGNAWVLTFTVKSDPDTQEDAQAAFQKASGAGITVEGSVAMVEIVPQDTAGNGDDIPALPPGLLYWDVQARAIADGAIRTVAAGTLCLTRDVTREVDTSIPIYTTNPPLPGSGGGSGNIDGGFPDSDYSQIPPVDGGTP